MDLNEEVTSVVFTIYCNIVLVHSPWVVIVYLWIPYIASISGQIH